MTSQDSEGDPADHAALATWTDLVAAVEALRPALAAQGWRNPLCACEDRLHVAAVLFACWSEGRTAVLPPNTRPATVAELMAAGAADAVVGDAWVAEQLRAEPPVSPAASAALSAVLGRRGPERLVTAYSSGSTGAPVASHKTSGQLLGEAEVLAAAFGLGAGARVLSTAPAHHLYGLLFSLLVPAVSGGSFVRQTPLHAETIAALARALEANVLVSVPPHLHGLQALEPGALPALKIFCSGGRLPAGVAAALRQRFGVPVTEIFGSTETGGIAWRTGDADEAWTPLPGVQVSAGAEGLLLVDSPFLDPSAPRPFAAADRIAPRPDGRFLHLGRADAVVKVAGERVSLAEIEQRLLAVPGVLDAAVVALEDAGPRQHELGAAVVAPGLTAADLRRALRQHLDPVAIPRRFALLSGLPREATGKLPRQRLLALFQSPSADGAEAQP